MAAKKYGSELGRSHPKYRKSGRIGSDSECGYAPPWECEKYSGMNGSASTEMKSPVSRSVARFAAQN